MIHGPDIKSTTRWWWVRHAPVVGLEGRIYGSDDVACDTSDTAAFASLARRLPADAVWLTSHLGRTHATAQAIREAGGLAVPVRPIIEQHLGEQCFGAWQGKTWDEMETQDPDVYRAFWADPTRNRPPEGESFADQIARTGGVVERHNRTHAGRDIVAVTHAGTIRGAIAHALGMAPESAMALTVSPLSLTRLDYLEEPLLRGHGGAWRVVGLNQPAHDGAAP